MTMDSEAPHSINRLLVPVDFSPQSREALRYAALLAERFGAKLDVLHVWEMPHFAGMDLMLQAPVVDSEPLEHYVREQASREMSDFLKEEHLHDDLQVTERIEAGDVDAVIVKLAEAEHYDLIVMGTHGRSGLAHLLMVAEKVIRNAPCPVLTVRHGAQHHGARASVHESLPGHA
jgi:universal stress protein A